MNRNTTDNNTELPAVIFGTSGLGNIYQIIPYETKLAIVRECIENAPGVPVFDSAGKYGAGLALEVLGQCLQDLKVPPDKVLISNKLAWYQTPLLTPEPLFEKEIWKGMKNDAVQKISYNGILECFYQGNELLGNYAARMVSVHDPDEYLAAAKDKEEEERRYQDILEAYRALGELKAQGKVSSVGVGSKQWEVIRRIANDVPLDWVMIANSLTLHSHPKELLDFIGDLHKNQVVIINSAVFNGGFLIGSNYYNYHEVNPSTREGQQLYKWRDGFFELCRKFDILPAEACFSFGLNIPGVESVALSTTDPAKVKRNIAMSQRKIPKEFWHAMVDEGLLEPEYLTLLADN